ncbi:MAG: Rrf2 family transcriptional regulator [bacterium]|nr:Rrf2 family transcriptional regulator [bacterium]
MSQKSIYGVLAALELAKRYADGPQNSRCVAEDHGIPCNYLEQVLAQLKRGGIVNSFRGSQGGYALARSPQEILVKNVLECLDGSLSLVSDNKSTVLDFFWHDAQTRIEAILDVSLADLIVATRQYDNVVSYSI